MRGGHVGIAVRKALEALLQQERDFLRGLTETSVSGILALDGAGGISFANREAGEILGLDEAGLTGQSLIGALREVHTLGAPLAAAKRPDVLGIRDRVTLRDQRLAIGLKDGRQKAISVNAAPMRLFDGRVQAGPRSPRSRPSRPPRPRCAM